MISKPANKEFLVVPALDTTSLEEAVALAGAVGSSSMVSGFKIGFSLGLAFGLPQVAARLKAVTDKPLIYDHQKAGTDIPDTGPLFARTLAAAGIDAAILFPQAGPATLKAWTDALRIHGLDVIVGGIMTHPAYVETEGGFIREDAIARTYRLALEDGVRSFVVPLTKPDAVRNLHTKVEFGDGCEFYSPGFGKQGGDHRGFDFIEKHHLIIGRSLLQADDPKEYLLALEPTLMR